MITTAVLCTAIGGLAGDKAEPAKRMPPANVNLENYTVKLQGKYAESAPVDLSLTGSGPLLSLNLTEPDLTFRVTLQPDNGRVRIEYTFNIASWVPRGTRVVEMASNRVERVPDYEYRQAGVTGSAVLSLGKPLAIVTVNQNKLELTVTKSTDEVSPKQ